MDKEYTLLFNAITDAIEILIKAQQQAEELVLSKDGKVVWLSEEE